MKKTRDDLSFEKVNYIFRPRKQIQRKILIEIFQDLSQKISNLKDYRYIGLGSIFFYDFILFHKHLGIKKMTSLDDKYTIKRFEFNRPYDFINFRNTATTKYFSEYKFNEDVIIWADYDKALYIWESENINSSIFEDIKIITNKGKEKSIFLLTVDVQPPKAERQREEFLKEFKKYLPLKFQHLRGEEFNKKFHEMSQEIILSHIENCQKFQDTKFHKLFAFVYEDGHRMLTIGGIFDQAEQKIIQNIRKTPSDFMCFDKKIINIDVPILTYIEKIYLDSIILRLARKCKKYRDQKISFNNICKDLRFELDEGEQIQNYVKFYKYYPQYYEGMV